MVYSTAKAIRKRTPLLIINSYAGSLTIAAHQQWHPIIGSYEDAGYGIPVQRENYPGLDYRLKTETWEPKLDLSSSITIAHPPCAAFSQQISGVAAYAASRGVDAEKFQCTKRVLEYALSRGTMALAVESVMPALEGARAVHDLYAKRHGYHVFRVKQNAVTFGLPQWRERFWCFFVRKDLRSDLHLQHSPVTRVVADVLEAEPSEQDPNQVKRFGRFRQAIVDGFGKKAARDIIDAPKHGHGILAAALRRYVRATTGETRDMLELHREHCGGGYTSSGLRLLDPLAPTAVLLGNSFWAVNGRVLSRREYCRVMGFPDDYRWPTKSWGHLRYFLSRGVAPPVAAWVLDQVERNLKQPRSYFGGGRSGRLHDDVVTVQPGEVADLRPSKKLWTEVIKDELSQETRS